MTGRLASLIRRHIGRGLKAHKAAEIAKIDENEVALVMEEEAYSLRKIEREYQEVERPKVQGQIAEWLADFSEQEKRNIRLRLLHERMDKARKEKDVSNLRTLVAQYNFLMGISRGVEPADIERARTYPIGSVLKSVRGMAKCPFHEDKTPSLDTRKNFFYCYGCGEHGDVITLVMRLENLDFAQAVKRLC